MRACLCCVTAVLTFCLSVPAALAVSTPTSFHGRLEIVYTDAQGDPFQSNASSFEIGGFVDDGWFESDSTAALAHDFGNYGLFNDGWPDYWIYGLNLSIGYRTTTDALAENPDLRSVLKNGVQYTTNPYAPGGQAMWTISYYNDTSDLWAGDGPHPTLDGNNGSFPNVYPNATDRQTSGNDFNPATDNPYTTVAWGMAAEPDTEYTRYDASGLAPGDPGYDANTAGFENGGYTVRHEIMTFTDTYGGGVWDFGPDGTLNDTSTAWGEGWGPEYVIEADFYHDPNNVSGLFGGNDAYGNPYVWTAINGEGDPSTFWYLIPEPGTLSLLLAAMGLLSCGTGRRRRRA